MSDIYNAKLRVKLLRNKTIIETAINPGNLLIDMDTQHVYLDMVDGTGNLQRVHLTGGVHYMGTVPTVSDLPTIADNGAMYNVDADGTNYVYSEYEKKWDKLSETIDLSVFYTKAEINEMVVPKTDMVNYYTKTEVYNKNETYNKEEINDIISSASLENYYTKTEADELFVSEAHLQTLIDMLNNAT